MRQLMPSRTPLRELLVVLALLTVASAPAIAQREVRGKVTEVGDGRARVQIEGSAAGILPADPVAFSTLMDGFAVAAGSGTVAQAGPEFVWVEQVDSRVTVGMDAVIRASGDGGADRSTTPSAERSSPDSGIPAAPTTSPPASSAVPTSPDPGGSGSAGLTLDELLAKHLDAIGGRAAWDAVEALRFTGTWAGFGPESRIAITVARPWRFRTETRSEEWGGYVFVGDGTQGWQLQREGKRSVKKRKKKDPPPAPQPLDRGAIDRFVIDPMFHLGGWLAEGESWNLMVELVGREAFDGTPAWRVDVTLASGRRDAFYFDLESFLLLARVDTAGEDHDAKTTYTDYRTVEGLVLPHKATRDFRTGGLLGEVVVERVEVNPPLDEATFAKPRAEAP